MTGIIYNHNSPLIAADVPGREYVEVRGGCPPGYRDAEVLLTFENTSEPNPGFFVAFN